MAVEHAEPMVEIINNDFLPLQSVMIMQMIEQINMTTPNIIVKYLPSTLPFV